MSKFNRLTAPSLDLVTVKAGDFVMGPGPISTNSGVILGEPHTVFLSEYQIGRYPVTNEQYLCFVEDIGHWFPSSWEKGYLTEHANHPVSGVNWADAWLFCAWLALKTGLPYHLPTEAEWEKAATWNTQTGTKTSFPWGNEKDSSCANTLQGNVGGTTPIGKYSPQGDSPCGCADMIGNVDEWCNSVVMPYPYVASNGREELYINQRRAMRGGDWYSFQSPATRRNAPSEAWQSMWGFRVALGTTLIDAHKELLESLKLDAVADEQALIEYYKEKPNSAQFYYDLGTRRSKMGEIDSTWNIEAEHDFDRTLELANSDKPLINTPLAHVYFNRARIRLNMEKYDLAIADMSQAITLDPSDAYAYLIRSDAYCSVGAWDKAEHDLDTALGIDKRLEQSVHVLKVRAQLLAQKGRDSEAMQLYTTTIQRPMYVPLYLPEIHLLRAELHEKAHQQEAAQSDYFHYLLWRPNAPKSSTLRSKI
ncbi:MAG: SUMF1/EgtB/PvdO family nonheme iron enzyme [Chloroflexota bacterium]